VVGSGQTGQPPPTPSLSGRGVFSSSVARQRHMDVCATSGCRWGIGHEKIPRSGLHCVATHDLDAAGNAVARFIHAFDGWQFQTRPPRSASKGDPVP